MNRRTFLNNSAKTFIALTGASAMASRTTYAANNRIVMGAIGLGGRGRDHSANQSSLLVNQ